MRYGGNQAEPSGSATALQGYINGQYISSIPNSASGSLGTLGGLNLINEEGTEAIITPQGTGIVVATLQH